MRVTLRPITADTVRDVIALRVAPGQTRFVAPNATSLAQALFSDQAWYRAIHHNEMLAGFVMLRDETMGQTSLPRPEVGLWRLMVDQRHQGLGIGRAAVRLVAEHVMANRGRDALFTSYVPGPDGPEGFYRALGFIPTGAMDEDEVVAVLELNRGSL